MKKCFSISLNLPVSVEVVVEEKDGEVLIIDVCNIPLPSVSDISDSLTDDVLREIDEAFAESKSEA